MELNDAIKTLAGAMKAINDKIGDDYVSTSFVLYRGRDLKIRTYVSKWQTSYVIDEDSERNNLDITTELILNGLKNEYASKGSEIREEISKHEEKIKLLKEALDDIKKGAEDE